ncbi:MAG: methylenetetrahydrofolate reductase [Candidatus Neomarinimicrobiota bacterium]
MKVVDHLKKASKGNGTLFSFEIVPPERGGSAVDLISIVEDLVKYKPPFIDITSHSAEVRYIEKPNNIEKEVKRKRPGTLGICSLVQWKYGIDAIPHVLCRGFTREETEDFLIDSNFMSIQNVLALRGDAKRSDRKEHTSGRSINEYAIDLVKQIRDMNKGIYLDGLGDNTSFCIGVAGYPEKHPEAPNMETDLKYLKFKVEAGADYIVTQMCFDTNIYFKFVEMCRDNGINIPIIPGIKIIGTKNQLKTIPRVFKIDIPYELSDKIEQVKEQEEVENIGISWAEKQIRSYVNDERVPAVHIYVTNDIKLVKGVMDKFSR